jgi:capsular exopolysaccharide synthesis family protein
MVWRRRWVVLACVIAATAAAFVTRPAEPKPLYTSTVSLRVQTFNFTATGAGVVATVDGVPPAEIERARSVEVAAETAQDLGLGDNGAELLSSLVVTAQEGTDLLQISLTGSGLETERRLETYAQNYVDFRDEQDEAQIESALRDIDAVIATIEPELNALSEKIASGDDSPKTQTEFETTSTILGDLNSRRTSLALDAQLAGNQIALVGSPITQRVGTLPTRTLRLLAGPIVGLLLGCALAIGIGALRPRLTSREQIEESLGYPVLATIPRIKNKRLSGDPLVLQRSSGWGAEALRMLRTELSLIEERGTPLKVICVASPEPRDGKSTVAANLAASYSSAGKKTVLVNADLRAARKDRTHIGLTDYLSGRNRAVPVMKASRGFDEVMPGPMPAASDAASAAEKLVEGVEQLRDDYEVIVVDTAPLLAFSDALMLALEASAVVLVVRSGKTLEYRAAEALDVLVRHDAAIAGIVLNDKTTGRIERFRYRRYYHAWSEEDDSTGGDLEGISRRGQARPASGGGAGKPRATADSDLKQVRR